MPVLPQAPPECPECGSRLAQGVCPACAFGNLMSLSSGLPPTTREPARDLDLEFGRYQLTDRLASGGMGVVYSAEDRKLKRTVALKMIRGSTFAREAELARFKLEAEAAATLDHPHIVPIYEVGLIDEQPYFTMKRIDGESLAMRLQRAPGHKLPAREIAELLSRISRAVHHAHQRGVLHRDLKPGNILLDAKGTPWLTDFGLAKFVHNDSGLTLTTDHLGTPNYMSPEVARGAAQEVSTASDVWALGVILWEALCGELPFAGASPVDIMRRINDDEPAVPRGESPDQDLLTLARRCMEKDPARRLESAAVVADELDRWLRGEPLRVRPITTGERVVKWIRRNPAWTALTVAVLVGSISSLLLWQRAVQANGELTSTNQMMRQLLAVTTTTKLSLDARFKVRDDPAVAVLLAAESVDFSQRQLGTVLPAAAESLYETLQQVGGWDVSPYGPRKEHQPDAHIDRWWSLVYAPLYSPDSRWVLTIDYAMTDGTVAAIFDTADASGGGPVSRWSVWDDRSDRRNLAWVDPFRLVSTDIEGTVTLIEPDLMPAPAPAPTILADAPDLELPIEASPPSRVLGSIGLYGWEVRRMWLEYDEASATIHGIALYDSNFTRWDVAPGKLSTFRFDPDADEPIADLRVRDLPPGVEVEGNWIRAPHGEWLCGESEESVVLINLKDEMRMARLPFHPDFLVHQIMSPDGRWMAVRKGERTVLLYDLTLGAPEDVVRAGREIYTHDDRVDTLDFSTDGRLLSVTGEAPTVTVLTLPGGELLTTLRDSSKRNLFAKFSPDGKWLAAGSQEHVLTLWEVAKIRYAPKPLEFRGLPNGVMNVAFSPHTTSMVAAGSGCHYRYWPFNGRDVGHLPETLAGRSDRIIDLANTSDGNWLATACSGRDPNDPQRNAGYVKLYDMQQRRGMTLTIHGTAATGVCFSPDDRWLASIGHDGLARVWELADLCNAFPDHGAEPPAAPAPRFTFDMAHTRLHFQRRVAFTPDGTLFCTCGDGILFEWNLNDPDPVESHGEHPVHSIGYLLPDVIFSPDGRWAALARHGWDNEPKEGEIQHGNMVLLFEMKDRRPSLRAALPAKFLEHTTLSFSPDSRWLAAGSAGYGALVWDTAAEDIPATMIESPGAANRMIAVAFSPDGQWLGLGGSDGRIHLWDWRNHGAVRTIATGSAISSLSWLDDTRLVSGGRRGVVELWETDPARLRHVARLAAGRGLLPEENSQFKVGDPQE